ncbi:MAG: hypothetical protein JWP12_2653 [Bacteroidetes bacterium]|nr:hypothetical protein [Bacteroidota bacterium]
MLITLDSDDIVHVKYLHGQVIDVAEKKEELKANLEITGGNKMPFLLSFESYVTITKEAKEYSIEIELQQPFLVTAIIVDNLAYQLMADFYFKFYKPKVPYKVFKSETRALEWLLEYRNDHNEGKITKSKKLPFFNF